MNKLTKYHGTQIVAVLLASSLVLAAGITMSIEAKPATKTAAIDVSKARVEGVVVDESGVGVSGAMVRFIGGRWQGAPTTHGCRLGGADLFRNGRRKGQSQRFGDVSTGEGNDKATWSVGPSLIRMGVIQCDSAPAST